VAAPADSAIAIAKYIIIAKNPSEMEAKKILKKYNFILLIMHGHLLPRKKKPNIY
jgi:hypothetical protein